jgi:stearoyl-CoA desaturase (delta-9 desaturase)
MTEHPLPFHDDAWWQKAVTLVAVSVPFLLTIWAFVALWGEGLGWMELTLLVGFWGLTGICISVGFHRMLTHDAFEAHPEVKVVLLSLGSMALQGRPADWAATHTRHHAEADEEGDPHSPLDGFVHAHLGWMFRDRLVRDGPVHEKLEADTTVRVIGDLFPLFAVLTFALPALVGGVWAGSWAGAWSGLLWGGAVRVFMGHHITWSVNSVSHMFGDRPFDTDDEARNNPIVALLGFGEGWHNNHHAYPTSAEIGHAWWQLDPGRALIRILEKMGLVWNVHRPHEAEDREATAAADAAETAAS